MYNGSGKQNWSCIGFCLFIVWFVINVRVSAGYASTFERAVDGLVGGLVLLGAVLLALRFFGGLDAKGGEVNGKKE